ncbi:MAG TPA: DUF1570 domain-containing protein [Planctomycetaceae bacterium]|nr:DUF1570 domain-containing protein [Planctomycetaceae bacterium]
MIARAVGLLLALTLGATTAPPARADARISHIELRGQNGELTSVSGRVLVEAQDGGLLVEARDGTLWSVTTAQLQRRTGTTDEFRPMDSGELSRQLLDEFGPGFEVITTRHYVICTNAGRKYAEWCGSLFERLMDAFLNHWRSRPLRLAEPSSPLIAIVFASEQEFSEFAERDAGSAAAGAKGYYSIRTNRTVLFDLSAAPGTPPARTPADINRKVAASPLNVATIVHEATHQIAFNCGLHTRYADNPLWLTEGMAMYFETPDLDSRTGWRTVGRPNAARLTQFHDYVRQRRPADSLAQLISSDARFTDAAMAADAYAEAWALSYFLIKTRRKDYVEYLDRLSRKPPLFWDQPEDRRTEFEAAFGDLAALDRQFLKYLTRVGR